MDDKKKVFKKKEIKTEREVRDKRQEILDSKMPEWQKQEYIEQLFGKKKEVKGVPFSVYARLKKVPEQLHKAMLVFPSVKGVETATLEEWDRIFKNF